MYFGESDETVRCEKFALSNTPDPIPIRSEGGGGGGEGAWSGPWVEGGGAKKGGKPGESTGL